MFSHRKAKKCIGIIAMVTALTAWFHTDAFAATGEQLRASYGGVAIIIEDTGSRKSSEYIKSTLDRMENSSYDRDDMSNLVMANVQSTLNVRKEPSVDSEKVGCIYKDCGGTILERGDEWTLLKSGNVIGWCSNEYLLFGEDAENLASNVGMTLAKVKATTLRVRDGKEDNSSVIGLLPLGEIVEVVDDSDPERVMIDYEGRDGYVKAEFVEVTFHVDAGETIEEIKAREEAEREAKRHVNYGQYTTDADTTLLLAALIQCEAGGEPYEGQVAVGAVVMNRVRHPAYPDSIHGVIYASGQFTPAMNGKVNAVYASGRIYASCIQAANEALAGTSNVGACTHFRRNNGRDGIVIGNHVFY